MGLTLSASGVGYMWYAGRPRRLEAEHGPADLEAALDTGATQLQALTDMLLVTFLLFIAFVIGSYVMVRFGRLFLSRQRLGGRTPYVDAWGAYRLTDADIAAATHEPDQHDEPPASETREP